MGILCSVKRFRLLSGTITIVLGRKLLLEKARGCLNNGDTFWSWCVSTSVREEEQWGEPAQLSPGAGVRAQEPD